MHVHPPTPAPGTQDRLPNKSRVINGAKDMSAWEGRGGAGRNHRAVSNWGTVSKGGNKEHKRKTRKKGFFNRSVF